MSDAFRRDARRITELAWPAFIGQVSVVAFATVDTVLLGRQSAAELAALAVGGAAYITVFIGLMGVVLALGPVVGQLYGAERRVEAGRQLHQAVWLALALALVGSALLVFPEPFVRLARLDAAQEHRVREYLRVLALSLPASLLFTCYRSFNHAVSRPKAVMALQLGGLALKVPLSVLLVAGVPSIGLAPMGVTGCAASTAIVMWLQFAVALFMLRHDRFYQPFELWGHGLHRPDPRALAALLRLGLPMGLAILIEVSGFTFMAIFIARQGPTAVAGHQIAVNLVSLMFMVPMAIANATGTLVAQRVGARDEADARRLGRHGIVLGVTVAAAMGVTAFLARGGIVRLYATDAAVIAATLPLLAWMAVFHVADATQTLAASVLRAWHVATRPMLIFAFALGGVGLGGGYLLAFDVGGLSPPALHGAPGFWAAATAGLALAAVLLLALLAVVMRRPPPPAAARA